MDLAQQKSGYDGIVSMIDQGQGGANVVTVATQLAQTANIQIGLTEGFDVRGWKIEVGVNYSQAASGIYTLAMREEWASCRIVAASQSALLAP